jgi:hypothetical protein
VPIPLSPKRHVYFAFLVRELASNLVGAGHDNISGAEDALEYCYELFKRSTGLTIIPPGEVVATG